MTDFITNIFHSEGNPRNSEGSMVQLQDGRILFIYTRYNSTSWSDEAHADLVAITSSDGGKTWSDWRVVIKNRAQNVMSVSLLRLQNGRIALVFPEKSIKDRGLLDKQPNDPGIIDCRPYISFSDDEGLTWTKPEDMTKYPPIYIVGNNDRLIQLSTGRLIYPIAIHHLTPFKPGSTSPYSSHQRSETYFLISDDQGLTWRESKQCCYPPQDLTSGLREPGVVELSDGSVMAWFRTNSGSQWKAFSHDGGDSWSAAQPAPEFLSMESPLSIKRNPWTKELVAVWSDLNPKHGIVPQEGSWNRTPLVIARSSDEAKTWTRHRLLEKEPDHGYCYISMLFASNGLILSYCCGGGKDSAVLQDLRVRRIE